MADPETGEISFTTGPRALIPLDDRFHIPTASNGLWT